MLTEQNLHDGVAFNFPTYHDEDALNTSLDKMYTDPRAVAILYGCGVRTTTDGFKEAIERTLELKHFSNTITIQDLVFTGSDKCLTIDDIIDTMNCDDLGEGLVDDYRIERAAYAMACVPYGEIIENVINAAYVRFVYKVAELSNKHVVEHGIEDLMEQADEQQRLDTLFGTEYQ